MPLTDILAKYWSFNVVSNVGNVYYKIQRQNLSNGLKLASTPLSFVFKSHYNRT